VFTELRGYFSASVCGAPWRTNDQSCGCMETVPFKSMDAEMRKKTGTPQTLVEKGRKSGNVRSVF
jgi:hypothetical protein